MSKNRRKSSKKLIVALIVLIVAVAVALAVVYFAAPDVWAELVSRLTGEDDGPDGTLIRGEGDLQVHFLDVGQGDCILILFPDGKDMLIDCANYNDSGDYETKTLQYLDDYVTDGRLDYLMLTHSDSDHVYFMNEVLEAYDVDNVFMPNIASSHEYAQNPTLEGEALAQYNEKKAMFTDPDKIATKTYAEFFVAALTEPDCEITLNVDDDKSTNNIVIGDEANTYELKFYCPTVEYYATTGLGNNAERKNAVSPIGVLEYNGFRIVFTGDSNEINEPIFVDRVGGSLDCDVLKVGHHGSATSTTEEFLECISIEYAVISCNSAGNTFNHPRQATLDRLRYFGAEVYRTDNNGTVVLTVNAELTFTVEKTAAEGANFVGADTQ